MILARSGEFDQAAALREEAATAARAAGDEALLARVQLAEVEVAILHDPTATIRDGLANAEQAIAELERVGDDEGAAWALRVAGNLNTWLGNTAEALRLWERAFERAMDVSPRLQNDVLFSMTWTLWLGTTPADEGIRRCDEVIRDSTSKRLEATALVVRGNLKALRGRLDEGRADAAAGRSLFQELGDQVLWAASSQIEAHAELSAGNAERAYELLAEAQDALAAGGGSGLLVSIVGMRGHAALELGRDDEALELAEETGRTAAPDDLEPHATSRLVRARVLARRGDFATADELLREAAEIVEPTDYAILHLELALAQADVARAAGRPEDARRALERATEVAETKGNVVATKRARRRLAEL